MTRTYRKATVKDVAQHAGVSPTTVSHFLSGRVGTCSPETAEKIRIAADTLHYTPSSSGRALRLNATNTIGIALQSIYEFERGEDGFSYMDRLMRGITQAAGEAGYALLFYPPKIQSGKDYRPFLDGRVDALLFHAAHDDERPSQLAEIGIPVVSISRTHNLHERCGSVFACERDTVRVALDHLWERGHRRIAHIAGPVLPRQSERWEPNSQSDIAIERLREYTTFLSERGVFDPALVAYENSWDPQNPVQIVAGWQSLASPPSAVFCACDTLAYGFIAAARAANWHIPEQLAVIGVDNHPMRQTVPLPVTSVDIPLEAVGAESVRLLLQLINHELEPPSHRVAVPVTRLIIGETT